MEEEKTIEGYILQQDRKSVVEGKSVRSGGDRDGGTVMKQ